MSGLYVEEIFQFDKQWYGVLKSTLHDDFMRYVKITRIGTDGYDFSSLPQAKENAIAYFRKQDGHDDRK